MSSVTFIHHHPHIYNLGDDLCSPKHYFEFVNPRVPMAIVGGGVFADLGQAALARHQIHPSNAILWGAGQSVKRSGHEPALVSELPYADWGLRDIDHLKDPDRFLPCVSCLHPMFDVAPQSDRTLLFLNADPRVTGVAEQVELQKLAALQGWDFLLNSCTAQQFEDRLALTSRVLTNSFHGAYWGWLSGREVGLVGYSSKFVSLARAMGIDHRVMPRYEKPRKAAWIINWLRPESMSLSALMRQMALGGGSSRLLDAHAVRQKFRSINLSFARRLQQAGNFETVVPRHMLGKP
jgi:hypothetical protein